MKSNHSISNMFGRGTGANGNPQLGRSVFRIHHSVLGDETGCESPIK